MTLWITEDKRVCENESNGRYYYPLQSNLKRVQYALGNVKPNYPVPAIRHKVNYYASGDCIEIRSFKGIGSNKSFIDRIWWKPI